MPIPLEKTKILFNESIFSFKVKYFQLFVKKTQLEFKLVREKKHDAFQSSLKQLT